MFNYIGTFSSIIVCAVAVRGQRLPNPRPLLLCRSCCVHKVLYEIEWPFKVQLVESSWNVMEHGDAREGKWRGNKRMEWVTSKRHMTAEHRLARAVQTLQADVYSSPASSRLNWRPATDLNGLVRFAERQNLVSARVPSHFKRSLLTYMSVPYGLLSFNFKFNSPIVFMYFICSSSSLKQH